MTIKDLFHFVYRLLTSESFWTTAQFIAVLISLIFLTLQVRLQRYTHLVTILQTLDDKWSSEEMIIARRELCLQWQKDKMLPSPACEYVSEFFEQLAIYRKLKAIPDDFLWETYSWYIEYYHSLCQYQLPNIREIANDQSLFVGFDDLEKTMTKMSARKKINVIREEKSLDSFVLRELSITELFLSKPKQISSKRKQQ